MRISPGPPDYTYGGILIDILPDASLVVDLRLRHIQHDIHGDTDYGLGIRRIDGWLVARTHIHLQDTGWDPDRVARLRRLIPMSVIVVRTHDGRPGPGVIPATLWAYGEDKSVNDMIRDEMQVAR